RMAVVRLEVANPLNKETEKYLCEKFKITPACIFRTKIPMKLDYIFSIMDKVPASMKRSLVDVPFAPQPAAQVGEGSVMAQVKKRDILLSYPYESMDPFLKLIKEASTDPDVMTIKITIYRLAKKTRLVEYLCAAAENGKEVTALIELRARFDEQNNIEWSERMEEAGCRVLYGFDGYKVHSKICLITYRSKNEIKYITQIGTGNYNEKTAKLYTDYSLMTANQSIGEDAAVFFKNMSIGNLDGTYKNLIVSPTSLKQKILALMDEEIQKGEQGRIVMKMNSVTDMDFIRKVAEASRAGVKVDLIVRGICCILPGIAQETENLTVTSIVGRYLEHPRVFVFGTGAEQKVYIGSADMMTRNTEKRVEVACPILNEEIKKRLVRNLHVMLADNVKARVMTSDGTYRKKKVEGKAINSQEIFMKEALMAKRVEKKPQKQTFLQKMRRLFQKE
ncbi:MAG: polyphosphate kinase 1, partial [Mediterraneibacter gnavus]